jgi:hypothetical protein
MEVVYMERQCRQMLSQVPEALPARSRPWQAGTTDWEGNDTHPITVRF